MAEKQKEKVSVNSNHNKMSNQLMKVFNKFDTNGDGKISISDLGCILNMLSSKTSSEEVKGIMAEIDTDGDGFIDFEEFEAFYLGSGGKDTNDRELRDAFNLYDKNKNGKICDNELYAVMKSLGEKCSIKDCRKMISSVDVDGDGCVNFEEFKRMMSN